MENPRVTAPEVATAAKAETSKRLLAYVVDLIVAGIAAGIVGIFSHALGSLAAATYLLLRDGLDLQYMQGRSLGKHVMGLAPVRLDGGPMDIETSMRRNWPLAISGLLQASIVIPALVWIGSLVGTILVLYEAYRVMTDPAGRRWGDDMAGTCVVEAPVQR